MPHAVWIWDLEALQLATLLVFIGPVRSARWDPNPDHRRLAVCTGGPRVYLWTEKGISWVDVPTDGFEVRGLRWRAAGSGLALLSRDSLCVCYPADA